VEEPERYELYTQGFVDPPPDGSRVEIYTGPNIIPPPEVPPVPERTPGRVLLRLGHNISTDEILPAGNDVLPLRSNIPAISEYTFRYVDPSFPRRAREAGGGFIVAGENYGQGSSREHAAATVMYLGVRAVLALSYARIHESNLVNFGIPPLRFEDPSAYEAIMQSDELEAVNLRSALERGEAVVVRNRTRAGEYRLRHALSSRQLQILLAGGLSRQLRLRGPAAGSNPTPATGL
jgi:aconitate hydratase